MIWTPLQQALNDMVTKQDFPNAYKLWIDKKTSPKDFEQIFVRLVALNSPINLTPTLQLKAYYPAKALEDTGITSFLVPSFDLLTRSENELKAINPNLRLHDAELMTRVMVRAIPY